MSYKQQADPYGRGSYCIVVAMTGNGSREAEILRSFRDEYISEIPGGERLISLYYRMSPAIVGAARKLELQSPLSRVVSMTSGLVEHIGLY
ncbi:MAG: CFI-box-CTERM domain-containing protein [Candidatus Nanohaloarchaea archaeon]